MRSNASFILSLATCFILSSCEPETPPKADYKTDASVVPLETSTSAAEGDLQDLINGNNEFAFDLYFSLIDGLDHNLFLSPYSISSALSTCALGAKAQTWNEMKRVLHWPYDQRRLAKSFSFLNQKVIKNEEQDIKISLANALWIQSGFPILPSFINSIQSESLGEIESVDFRTKAPEAVLQINHWVAEKTENHIHDLLSDADVGASTTLIITNAIYMKAAWQSIFPEKNTEKAPFHLISKEDVNVDMMHQTHRFRISQQENYSFLELPYKSENKSLVMYLLLPHENTQFKEVETLLSQEKLDELKANLQMKNVAITLPKLELGSKLDLNSALKQLGMTAPFSAKEANFSGIDGNEDLILSKVVHSAWITVDEKGTEAAAATAAIMNLTATLDPEGPVEFKADHPFIFMIAEQDTAAILFLGRVMNPETL